MFANGDAEAGLSHLLQAIRLKSTTLEDEYDVRLTQGMYGEMVRTLMDVSGDVAAAIKIWSHHDDVFSNKVDSASIVSSVLRSAFRFLPSVGEEVEDEEEDPRRHELVLKNVLNSKDDVLFFFEDDQYVCRNRTNSKCFFSSVLSNDTNTTRAYIPQHHDHHHHRHQNNSTRSAVFSISASGPCENMPFEQINDEDVSRIMKLGEIMLALSRTHSAMQCFVRR